MGTQRQTWPLGILAGWREAWRGRHANPLPLYWRHAEARRTARLHWSKRSPGLFWTAVVLTAGVLYAIVRAVFDLAALGGHSPLLRSIAQTSLIQCASLALLAALVLCLCWLLARLYSVAQLALGFLEQQPRRQLRQTLDDLLAVSRLSEQEILSGFCMHGLQLMHPPLLGLSLAAGLTALVRGMQAALQLSSSDWAARAELYLSPLSAACELYLTGMLASLALILLLITLGLAERSGLMPYIGAAAQVVMQLILVPAGIVAIGDFALATSEDQSSNLELLSSLLGFSFTGLLALALLYYIARRLDWLRNALGYALPLVLLGFGLVLYGQGVLASEAEGALGFLSYVGWSLQPLVLLSPSHFTIGVFDTLAGGSPPQVVAPFHVQWAVGLAMQLVFIAVFAEFARDAIRRRKWGTG